MNADIVKLVGDAQRLGLRRNEEITPGEARAAFAGGWHRLQVPARPTASVKDHTIGTSRHALALRISRGEGTRDEVQPGLLFLHRGGWMLGNVERHERMCHILATLVGIAVVAVDYRLVPDHPIPAAIDDAAKALRWLSGNARELSIDPDRTAVGGDSGGGNLSSVLAIMARVDRFLLSFFRHWPIRLSIKRRKAPLMKRTRKGCRSPRIRWAGSFNCLSDDAVGLDWRTFPIPVASVAGLAPLLVITMGNDPLRDEGRDYAKILKSVGPCSNVLELH